MKLVCARATLMPIPKSDGKLTWMARPSEYEPDIAAALLTEIATTRDGINAICASRADFPDPKTVYRWMLANVEFRQGYARAKEDQTQVLEDEILAIADTTAPGEIVTVKADGSEERKVSDMIDHRKLQIESRKWLMGKLRPKKYGDKLDVNHGGEVAIKRVVADL